LIIFADAAITLITPFFADISSIRHYAIASIRRLSITR
jgi:hypothetical protein